MKSKILTLTMLLTCSLSFSMNLNPCQYKNRNECYQSWAQGCRVQAPNDGPFAGRIMCAFDPNNSYGRQYGYSALGYTNQEGTMASLGYGRLPRKY